MFRLRLLDALIAPPRRLPHGPAGRHIPSATQDERTCSPAAPPARRRMSLAGGLAVGLFACIVGLPSAARAQADDAASRAAERARAEALEAEGKALRAQAEATYEATIPACQAKFLVNHCIDQAKKARLETIQRARELEAEARRLDLAERQRVAAEAGARAERPLTPAAPTALPQTPAAAPSSPATDARITPSPEAERIRARRARSAGQAATGAQAERAARDAERAAKRAETEAEAEARAAAAERDRARYEERIRRHEEDQATKKK